MKIENELVTAIFLSYNNSSYLCTSLESFFNQTYSNIQYLICDDCSSDDSVSIINSEIEKLPEFKKEKIEFIQNVTNLGVVGTLNKLMLHAKGNLCIVFASDDISVLNRVESTYSFWLMNNRPSSIFSALVLIDENDKIVGQKLSKEKCWKVNNRKLQSKLIFRQCNVFGCSHAWTRNVFIRFGPLNSNVINEDRTIPLRSALLNGVKYIPEKLVLYRVGTGISSLKNDDNYSKLFVYNKVSAVRELNDLNQNYIDASKVNSKLVYEIKKRISEVQLQLYLSEKNLSFFEILRLSIIAIHSRARIFRVIKLIKPYIFYKG